MPDNERERQPKEMSPMRRFYNDIIYFKDDDLVGVHSAIENMLVGTSIPNEYIDSDAIFTFIHEIEDPSISKQTRRERYMLLPMGISSEYMEMTQSPQVIHDWYKEMTSLILQFNKKHVPTECFSTHEGTNSCGISEVCPIKYTCDVLSSEVRLRDFTLPLFMWDFTRGYDIAIKKMQAAIDGGLLDPVHSQEQIVAFSDEYTDYFKDYLMPEKPESQS